jgi:hypothetical protein
MLSQESVLSITNTINKIIIIIQFSMMHASNNSFNIYQHFVWLITLLTNM